MSEFPNKPEQVDTYALYVAAFQNPIREMVFLQEEYSSNFGKRAITLREDFCGTFANCLAWISLSPDQSAVGVDVDDSLIGYGKRNYTAMSQESKDRLTLIHGDVLEVELPVADIVAALNCSFFEFKQRTELKQYFEKCFTSLRAPGMIVLEVYCGSDAQNLGCDEIPIGETTAIWEQARFDPVTNHCRNYIHFRLSDGTMINRAFVYDWRLWSPAECVDLLEEVGFTDVTIRNKCERKEARPDPTGASPTLFILGFKAN